MSFSQIRSACSYYSPHFNVETYMERTKRNHYWLGGIDGQLKLKDLRVGIAGLGGMGSNLAEIMVRLGVGHIKIADPDTIDVSNINRQVIATSKTVGQKKAIASANELRTIADDFELVVYDDGITKENVEEFVSDLDVIIDEIDVFPLMAHVWLHRAAQKKNIPLYSGFIIGLGTHVYKFQGTDFTFEDFLQQNQLRIQQPTAEFIVDRFCSPPPTYLSTQQQLSDFLNLVENHQVPIFGATTYMSQSLIAVRLIKDVLDLEKIHGGKKTPVMPHFIKLDPYDLKLEVHDIREQKYLFRTDVKLASCT